MTQIVSNAYSILNDSSAKPLVYVLMIEDVPYVFGTSTIYQRIKYGDPGLVYGLPGAVYGGLIPFGGLSGGGVDPNAQRPYLSIDNAGLTISQKVEPWEGKASVTTLNFPIVDINQEVLALISPGVEVDEILLKRVQFFVGFEGIGFPEEYIRLYRGLISGIRYAPGLITIMTSDPNLVRRQKLFEKSLTNLTSAINNSVTTIPVVDTDGFYTLINAPGSASPETGHSVGIKIEDEIITYTTTPGATSFTSVTRGAMGTIAASHPNDAEVTPFFYMEGNPLRIACKLMLSGWAGVHSLTNKTVNSFVLTGDPSTPVISNSVTFSKDLKDEYGLIEGDYVTISGATNGANNFTEYKINSFFDVGSQLNRGCILEALTPLVNEGSTSAVASFRSQFDVYPEQCGLKMEMIDVETSRHVQLANEFMIDEVADFAFNIIEEEDSGKTFIEKELYAPIGGFSLTRSGKCSVVITSPPLAISNLITLDGTNVIDANKAVLERAVNNRKFYNRFDISFDYDITAGSYLKYAKYIDSDSLNQIPYKEVLQIESKGMRSDRNALVLIDRIQRRLFERYSFAAQTINFKVTWQVGALLEAGDVILIDDTGDLLFPDLSTGSRGLGTQLWEVLEKSTDLKTGVTTLTIINGLGTQLTDKYGVISPSSLIETGLSTTQFRLQSDSFGALFPDSEYLKWQSYIGLKVAVFDEDHLQYAESVLTQIDDADQFLFTVDPPLGFIPSNGMILNLAEYSTSTDPDDQKLAKITHAYLSPVVEVVSGLSTTQFTVGAGDVAKFWIGSTVVVHTTDDATRSAEVLVSAISGVTITVDTALGFTPNNTMVVTFIGFSYDSSQSYRWYG